MDLNLENLKTEILDYLAVSDFGVFRTPPGALEGLPVVSWDTESFPDYRMFLDAARKAGQNMILFASREFEEDEILEALDELESSGAEREDQRDLETRLRGARRHVGSVCMLEMAFDYNSHLYVYEATPDWFDQFLEVCEEIAALFPGGDEDDDEDDASESLGGFYSNN